MLVKAAHTAAFYFMKKSKPILLITAGDPLGIGPEVTVKALCDKRVQAACTPLIISDENSLRKVGWSEKLAGLIAIESTRKQPTHRAPSAWGGEISFKALQLACKLTAQGRARALVTAPISKQSWALAGVPFTGHTEFLRKYYGNTALMMFVSGNLRCGLVSEHFAVKDLPKILSKQRIISAGKDFAQALKKLGIKNPCIGVSALNPHAGDNGKFGIEENKVIAPAIAALRKAGIKAEGPYPVDSLWSKHAHGQFDGILCMYHDQALLGLKLAAREPIVHITAGLKFLRTSPTHGTAFDIAGQNKADPFSMIAAILFAAKKN